MFQDMPKANVGGVGEIKELATFNIQHNGSNSNSIIVKFKQNGVEIDSQTITSNDGGATFDQTLTFTTVKNQVLSCRFSNGTGATIKSVINDETDIEVYIKTTKLTYTYGFSFTCYV